MMLCGTLLLCPGLPISFLATETNRPASPPATVHPICFFYFSLTSFHKTHTTQRGTAHTKMAGARPGRRQGGGLALALMLLFLLLDIAFASVLGGGPWGLPTRATTRAASPSLTGRGREDKTPTLQR